MSRQKTKSKSKATPKKTRHLQSVSAEGGLKPMPDPEERRMSPRFEIEFEAVIFCQGNAFRTNTMNVSLQGALLADSVPKEFVGHVLDLILIRNQGRSREFFLIKGCSLGSPFRSPRIYFTFVNDLQKRKLLLLFRRLANPIADAA